MEIKIEEYLSESEIKDIVISQFKESVKFKHDNDVKRIIENTAYDLVWRKVDEVFGESIEKVLSEKVMDIVSNMSEFSIFSKPNAWDKEPNGAYTFLQSCIESEKPNIKAIVAENVPAGVLKTLKDGMKNIIEESIQELYREII